MPHLPGCGRKGDACAIPGSDRERAGAAKFFIEAEVPGSQERRILLYRRVRGQLEVLLVHPGGPYWRNRDRGAWQIPKSEIGVDESIEAPARREAEEELGLRLEGGFVPVGQLRQAGGKIVACFAIEQDIDPSALASNRFELEWPPKSGRLQSFPEVDTARWFAPGEAENMMLASQRPFLARLHDHLAKPA